MTGDGTGVVAHAGSAAVRLLADRTGLTDALSAAVARRGFVPGHDRGRVLVDVATMIAAGGEAIADIDTLRHQREVLGPVASAPTVWRALDELNPASLKRIEKARVVTRARVWDLIPGGLPASVVAGTTLPADVVVLDVDATIVIAHSEKEQATRTFKKTFGYHPIGVWCDNSGEFLAGLLRPGNAGSNTTSDHIQVLKAAIAQVPASYRRTLLIRADGAGASHGLLDWLTSLNTATEHGRRGRSVEYSVGFAITETVRDAIRLVPKKAWTTAVDADGGIREHADFGLGDPGPAESDDEVVDGAGGHAVDVGLHHHRVEGLVDPPPRRGDKMLGKNDPARSFGTVNAMSPAWVVSRRGRDPLRSVVRDSVRSYRPAPITAVASASISSCIATRTHSRMKSVPSPVRNTSINSDTADWDIAIGEISFDEYLAVHIKNLAGGPLNQGAVPSPQTPPLQGALSTPTRYSRGRASGARRMA